MEVSLEQMDSTVIKDNKIHGNKYSPSAQPVDEVFTQDGSVDIRGSPSIKSKSGNWRACPFILANECCERLAYYGITTNLVNYLKDGFGQSNTTAANNVTNWAGTCYVTPLLGAFLADSYWGRFWTIAVFSTVYFIGMTLLTLSAFIPKLKPSFCSNGNGECHSSQVQIGVTFLALYLIALGTGGIKPCVSSFGADQFDEMDEEEKKKKSSFFNWFYLTINIGALVASSVLVWIQDNVGWGWGFGIPTVTMGIAICSFLLGTKLYRHKRPGGSALTRIAQVVVASARKWRIQIPSDKSLLYEVQDKESAIEGNQKLDHTDNFLFLDKAAVQTEDEKRIRGTTSPWQLTTVTQVEELKSIIRLLPIWASGVIFATVFSQMTTLFIEQGDTMNLHVGPNFQIPSASLTLFDSISVILWVPVYDQLIVPFACKYTGNKRGFSHLQRIGIGLIISTVGMVVAAIVEIERLRFVRQHSNNYHEKGHISMSIFWQIPQYFILGAAEVFTNIGNLEFFYDQAPDGMRSLCSALTLTTSALGSYLSTLLVTVVTNITTRHGGVGWIPANLNYGHLDYFFWLLAFLSFLNFLVFLIIAHWYEYKKPARSFLASKLPIPSP